MFDIAWTEMLVIAIVTIVVVGPRDLPKVMKTIASVVARARAFASKFQADMDELAREAELEELRAQAKAMHARLTAPSLTTAREEAMDGAAERSERTEGAEVPTPSRDEEMPPADDDPRDDMTAVATPDENDRG